MDIKTFKIEFAEECEYKLLQKVNRYEFFMATYYDEDGGFTDFFVVCKDGKNIEVYEDYECEAFYERFLSLQDEMLFERTKHIILWTAIAHKAMSYAISGDKTPRKEFWTIKTATIRRLFGDRVSRHCYACEYAGCEIVDNTSLEDVVSECESCPLVGLDCDNEDDDSLYLNCVNAWRLGKMEDCAKYALKVAYAPVKKGVKYR